MVILKCLTTDSIFNPKWLTAITEKSQSALLTENLDAAVAVVEGSLFLSSDLWNIVNNVINIIAERHESTLQYCLCMILHTDLSIVFKLLKHVLWGKV